MRITVEAVSKQTFKPTSTTPSHLNTLKLSLLDQLAPPLPVSLILFYTADDKRIPKTDCLKNSLPEILTHFYPLAGRISNNEFIDCNDEGINLFETRVDADISQLLTNPELLQPEEVYHLLPTDKFFGSGSNVLLSIQVNMFGCGGMALGVCISHKVADAAALGLFLKNWSSLARGVKEMVCPDFHTAYDLFPPTNVPMKGLPIPGPGVAVQCKRFKLDASNIAALKTICGDNSYTPTRVEAISALIWRCAMNAAGKFSSLACLTVNLRNRMGSPLSDSLFGNLVFNTLLTSRAESLPELQVLGRELHEAITKVDSNFVRELQSEGGVSKTWDWLLEIQKAESTVYGLTSWCRFPFYQVDFGWGKPAWICPGSLGVIPDTVILMDTDECGNGIEAWVTLTEQNMAKFECDPDLIAITSTKKMALA